MYGEWRGERKREGGSERALTWGGRHCYVVLLQAERARLAREKQMKEEAQREREEMERKMMELQEQVRLGQEALVSSCMILYPQL